MSVPVATTTGFGEIKHVDGVSPAWPVGYEEFEPWYTKAEWLYQVHGNHGEDPTEGHWSKQYPWPVLSHEPAAISPPWPTRSASASTSTSASHD